MGQFDNEKEKTEENPYEGLRQQVFCIKKSQELQDASGTHSIFASIVDMDMDNATVSLACIDDGTTSLYFSNGGGQLGLGHADEEIRKASLAFLNSAGQVLDIMDKVDEYPLPQNGKHFVYLITSDGVYRQELDMETIDSESKEKRFLNFLYQNVILKIGEYSQREK